MKNCEFNFLALVIKNSIEGFKAMNWLNFFIYEF